jgi:hypothetical protein
MKKHLVLVVVVDLFFAQSCRRLYFSTSSIILM